MAQPNITKIDVNGSSSAFSLESSINSLIDQSIKSGSMTDAQTLKLVTQDGTDNDIVLQQAKSGILSACEFAWTGALVATISAGNWQAEGKDMAANAPVSISFAARDSTFARIDLVCGVLSAMETEIIVFSGTPSSDPQVPALPAGNAPLYAVWIDPQSATTPNDFVIAAFFVNDPSPIQSTTFANGVKTEQLPTASKSITFDPLAPTFDADKIYVDTSGGAVTVGLPDPTDPKYSNREWLFIDLGNATAANITFDATASGAFTINGATDTTVALDYQQYRITTRGGKFYGW